MKPLTDDLTCPHCGGQDFTIAVDFTRYTRVDVVDGALCTVYDHEEENDEDSPRFFCLGCTEYLAVPKELL